MTETPDARTMAGRKPKQQSRSAEFRQILMAWKQTPVAFRPSLRALARELGTSHQLLTHYLAGLVKWQYEERYRKAKKESDEICARANAESRNLTYWEEQKIRACDKAHIQSLVTPALHDLLERIKREAKRGPAAEIHLSGRTLEGRAISFPRVRRSTALTPSASKFLDRHT